MLSSRYDENLIYDSLLHEGFVYLDNILTPDVLSYCNSLNPSSLEKHVVSLQEAGYSGALNASLFKPLEKTLTEISNYLISLFSRKKLIFRPRLLSVSYMYSAFSPEHSKKSTRAYLWHRDLDDLLFPMYKVMIPLSTTSESSGGFSVASKTVCPYSARLREANHYELSQFEDINDARNRISDRTMRHHFNDCIHNLYVRPGGALIFDAQSCYHKGGKVLDPSAYRINIQLVYGSPFNLVSCNRLLTRLLLSKIIIPCLALFYNPFRNTLKSINQRHKNDIYLY